MEGKPMDSSTMFEGFNEQQWRDALAEQSDYLKENYGYNLLDNHPIQPDEMNEMAREVIQFQTALAQALRDGVSHRDAKVKALLNDHITFLTAHDHPTDAASLLIQTRFLIQDDFHRKMLESTQIGLAYYYLASVEALAAN
jgi:hypothetical protein